MIKILERHIAKTIISATALSALIIIGVLFLMTLLGEAKSIGEGDYGLLQAIFYVFMRLPNEVYQFSPMLILLGSIMGLSVLSSQRELAVMRASGFAIRRIIYSVLFSALFMILIIGLIGELAGPNLSYKAEVRKENAQHADQAVVTTSGAWLHIDNNFLHIEHVVGRQMLEGVSLYQFDDEHHLQATFFAKKLTLEDKQWQMKDVVKTTFYHERTKSQAFAQVPCNLKLNPNLFNIGLVDPTEMSLPKLAKFTQYLRQNGLQASEYEFDFWQRVLQPLASLIMVFMAIPFVLGASSTAVRGSRILMGISAGFAFFILNAFLGQLCIVYQVPTLPAALIPLLLFAGLSLFLSNRLIRH